MTGAFFEVNCNELAVGGIATDSTWSGDFALQIAGTRRNRKIKAFLKILSTVSSLHCHFGVFLRRYPV
jgi:hypothetical protein